MSRVAEGTEKQRERRELGMEPGCKEYPEKEKAKWRTKDDEEMQ